MILKQEETPSRKRKRCLIDLSALVDEIFSDECDYFTSSEKSNAKLINNDRDFLDEPSDAVTAKSKTTSKTITKSNCADNNNILTSGKARRKTTQSNCGCNAGQ